MNNIVINRIFCAFPIFCPSESLFQRNLRSVKSFLNYVKENNHLLDGSKGFLLDCYWGGWSIKDEWFEELKNLIKNSLPEIMDADGKPINFIKVFRYDKNYGKAKIVNDLSIVYEHFRPDTQFLFTMDSDMVFMNSQVHFFERLFLSARCAEDIMEKNLGQKKPFGMVALNQAEANYHWISPKDGYTGMDQSVTYEVNGENNLKMNETLCWPSDGCGIAGGGLFINRKLFCYIGGYRKLNTPYASDDGLILRDCIQNGATAMIIKTLFLIHPSPDDDAKYLNFKEECMKDPFQNYDEQKYNENVENSKKVFE